MTPSTHRRTTVNLLFALCAFVMLPGCGGGAEDEADNVAESTPAAPTIDPRYASAGAIVGEFNALAAKSPTDLAALLTLMHAENDRQRELQDLMKQMLNAYPLESAMQDRFKESFDTRAPKFFAANVTSPAAVSNSQPERATATYRNAAGKSKTLHLVRFDNRWWISGLSLEQDPEFKTVNRDDIEVMGILLRAMKPVSPNLAQRVKVGEFKSASMARQAIQAAILERVANNPGDVLRLSDIGRKNSKYAALGDAAGAAGLKRSGG